MAGQYFGLEDRVVLRTHDDTLPQTGGEPIGRQSTPDRVEEGPQFRGVDGRFARGDAPLSRVEVINLQGTRYGCRNLLAVLKATAKKAPK